MQTLSGWDRLRILWAIVCMLTGIFMAALFASNLQGQEAFIFPVAILISATSAASVLFIPWDIKSKITFLWIGVMGSLGYADKGIDSLIMVILFGTVFWLVIASITWVTKGFLDPK